MKKASILLVEDDATIREPLREILQHEGYAVVTSTNGREALGKLNAGISELSLILLDLMMPVMNGWEFLEEIKKDPARQRVPVALITAYGERAPTQGVVACLRKPIEIPALLEVVRLYCE